MSAIGNFLAVARAYQAATGMKTTVLSWRLFGDSKKLGGLIDGADIQVTRWEKALQQLSDIWPPDADWPSDVPRPPPTEGAPVEPPPPHPSPLGTDSPDLARAG